MKKQGNEVHKKKQFDSEELLQSNLTYKMVTGEVDLICRVVLSAYERVSLGPKIRPTMDRDSGSFEENVKWFHSSENYPFSFVWCIEMLNEVNRCPIVMNTIRGKVSNICSIYKVNVKRRKPVLIPILSKVA